MKKLIGLMVLASAFLLADYARAEMDSKAYSLSVVGVQTNSRSIVLRGELKGVKVDVPTGATGTVAITSSELTLFSKSSISADTTYLGVVAAAQTAAGANATFDTNTLYVAQPMAGPVTVKVTGVDAPAAQTNNYIVTIIYDK